MENKEIENNASKIKITKEETLESKLNWLSEEIKNLKQSSKLNEEELKLRGKESYNKALLNSINVIVNGILNPLTFSELKTPVVLKEEGHREEVESILMELIKKLKESLI